MGRPTEDAKSKFDNAALGAKQVSGMLSSRKALTPDEEIIYKRYEMSMTWQLARGLSDMATGLRATYILLEEMRREINSLKQR
jgi:hypothetical protein